jgi:hypothetical protein
MYRRRSRLVAVIKGEARGRSGAQPSDQSFWGLQQQAAQPL